MPDQRETREPSFIEIAFVDVRPDAEGFEVRCYGCQRVAKLPFDPGTTVGQCPRCRRLQAG